MANFKQQSAQGSRPWRTLSSNLSADTFIANRGIDRNYEIALFLLVFIVAGIVRVVTIGQDSLWIDEGYTLASAGHSYGHIWLVPFDSHPPLHFALVKAFSVFGDGEVALRAPSALFATLTLIPLYLLARRLLGPVGALAAIAVFALSYTHLVYANNGRNYAVLLFFLTTCCLAQFRISERLEAIGSARDPVVLRYGRLYILFAIAALYTHNTAILYLFALNASACVCIALSDRSKLVGFTMRLAVLNALPILVWLPWLSVMMSTEGAFDWLSHAAPLDAARTLAATIGPNATPAVLVGFFLLAIGLGTVLSLLRPSWASVLIVLHLAVFPAMIWAIGFVYKPIYMERIILPALLGGPLAIGFLVAQVRHRALAFVVPALAICASAVSTGSYVLRGDGETNLSAHVIQDWRSAVNDHDAPGTALLICDTFSWPTVAAYADQADILVNHSGGVWDLTHQDWRANYGRPVTQRLLKRSAGEPEWMTRTQKAWSDEIAPREDVVFIKPDMLCNDGEPEIIRAQLSQTGFALADTIIYRGVRAEVWRPATPE